MRLSISWRCCGGTGWRRWPTCARVRTPGSSRTSARSGSPASSRRNGWVICFWARIIGGKPPRCEANAPALTYQVRVAQPEFRQGVDRLLRAVGTNRVALLCRERDPLECHRFHLICRYLRPQGLDIRHILPTGEAERQPATERRLLERTAKGQLGLFDDPGQAALERAYDDWWRVRGP
jgi:Protein of unknown function, DUF488